MHKYRVGIDIGGTFTDLVAFDENTLKVLNIKVSSTPRNPQTGVINSLKKLTSRGELEITRIVHSTTIGTNLFLGQKGLEIPRGALITTKGFRDVVEIGRQKRPELYNLFFKRPEPLIPRKYRFTVDERTNSKGEIVKGVDEKELSRIVETLDKEKIETVAITFLHSYANPENEIRVKDYILKRLPGVIVVASYEVDPEYREYERTSTTVVNAILIPVVSRYLENLRTEIEKMGIEASFYVMQSNGGLTTIQMAEKIPAATIESGPAAGVVAASFLGKIIGVENLLSFDMGGTTAKAGAVISGTPDIVTEYEVGGVVHAGRIIKGSGYPVRYPFIDLAEVSAGGGTIAWIDKAGALRCGPISAGADPGPVCYGKGGEEPTITDANLLLGRLNPDGLLGGEMKIYPELAEKQLKEKIADPLSLDITRAAAGIIKIINTHMVRALRIVSLERGYDPRSMVMIVHGGAGPLHAAEIAEELGVPEIVVPINPGLFSALGLIVSDVRHDFVRPVLRSANDTTPEILESIFKELSNEAAETLKSEGIPADKIRLERIIETRYHGQSFEIPVNVPAGAFTIEDLENRFHNKHEATYGYAATDEEVEFVNARVIAFGITTKPRFMKYELEKKAPEPQSERRVYFDSTGWVNTGIYWREDLRAGNYIVGPAIVEQYDSTTVVPPGWILRVDEFLNLRLRRKEND